MEVAPRGGGTLGDKKLWLTSESSEEHHFLLLPYYYLPTEPYLMYSAVLTLYLM